LFLSHYLTKTPFVKIPRNLYSEKFHALFDWCDRVKINFSLYYLGQAGCLGLIDGRKSDNTFGYIMTSTLSSALHDSIENTVLNLALRAFYYHKYEGSTQNISLQDFRGLQNPSFKHHGALALNVEYANSISFLFENPCGVIGKPVNTSLITHTTLVSSNHVLESIPASFVWAQSKYSQGLFLGFPDEKFLNLTRLSEFSGTKQSLQTILNLPHPMD